MTGDFKKKVERVFVRRGQTTWRKIKEEPSNLEESCRRAKYFGGKLQKGQITWRKVTERPNDLDESYRRAN